MKRAHSKFESQFLMIALLWILFASHPPVEAIFYGPAQEQVVKLHNDKRAEIARGEVDTEGICEKNPIFCGDTHKNGARDLRKMVGILCLSGLTFKS